MLNGETLLTLNEAAKISPGRPHATALWRHCRVGILSKAGGRVKLEHVRFGRRIFTSKEAISRFAQRLADADAAFFDAAQAAREDAPVPPRARSAAQRRADIAEAEAVLERAGI